MIDLVSLRNVSLTLRNEMRHGLFEPRAWQAPCLLLYCARRFVDNLYGTLGVFSL